MPTEIDRRVTLADRWFRNRRGELALGEPANLPIIVCITSAAISLLSHGSLRTLTAIMAAGTLFTWSWLELFSGTNYSRRLLGALALCGVIGFGLLFIDNAL